MQSKTEDLQALARRLAAVCVELDTRRRPVLLGDPEMTVRVRAEGSTLPDAARQVQGMLAAHPASRMQRF